MVYWPGGVAAVVVMVSWRVPSALKKMLNEDSAGVPLTLSTGADAPAVATSCSEYVVVEPRGALAPPGEIPIDAVPCTVRSTNADFTNDPDLPVTVSR